MKENFVCYMHTRSERLSNILGCGGAGASYSTMRRVLSVNTSKPLDVPLQNFLVVYFNNDQKMGKNYNLKGIYKISMFPSVFSFNDFANT